jgi:flagellar P-ring protein FlgI
MKRIFAALIILALVPGLADAAHVAARIKDIAHLEGVRDNQLSGMGLVVGLDGTGDNNSVITNQLIANWARTNNLVIPANSLRSKNVAAVLVNSNLPPYARNGNRIDVQVSSIGNAKSLQGGTLLTLPLRGADGKVHAVAMGAVAIGGFNVSAGGGKITKNHPTVGRIANGAIVEGDMVPTRIMKNGIMRFVLNNPDFTTASNLASSINWKFEQVGMARALDMSTIEVKMTTDVAKIYNGREVDLVAAIEELPVLTDEAAKVVIDERTGTVVVGENVRISTVAVSHSNFVVEISVQKASDTVVGPRGQIAVGETDITEITVTEETPNADKIQILEENVTIRDLVNTINAVNMSPRDLIAILQAIKRAGALKAELVIW